MPSNPLLILESLGQSVWLDSIRRGHILSGDLLRLIQNDGISGETSNPAIFEKAIVGSSDYDDAILDSIAEGWSAVEVYEALAVTDVQMAADVLRGVYDETAGTNGYVSLEVSPWLAHDTFGTIAEAARLWARVDRPNLMIKIPGTSEGLPAVEECLYQGINVNVTLLFNMPVYEEVAWTYIRALERRLAEGKPVRRLASVASFFVSQIDTLADEWIERKLQATSDPVLVAELLSLEGRSAVANAKLAYQRFKSIFEHPRFRALAQAGARGQRPLWASTSTKNPRYRDVLYVETLIGPKTINTLPFETIDAFRDHGRARATLEEDLESAERTLSRLEETGISLKAITDHVLREGIRMFAEPFDKLIQAIDAKREAVARRRSAAPAPAVG